MQDKEYLMENDEEALRLDIKTDTSVVEKQALWAGIETGMRVADIGCGSGKTTSILHKLVQPDGVAIGVDGAEKRIEYAKERYGVKRIEFICKDIPEPLNDLGVFDFVWVRFLLEYYRLNSFNIVKNISEIVKPGGILCLIDLDHNCLNHFGLSPRLETTLFAIMKYLEEKADFDPYMGRKLYSFLYDLGYQDINIDVASHHLIFGELKDTDAFNWMKKFEVVSGKINFHFKEYEGGYGEFLDEFNEFFTNPRRFTYTPVICCRGRKPMA
ncbi:class I SAM-dependent methyltransferase [uncultured Candidatus Kuenenia sp.]|jgi:SAM-dependent methyltransferase|uniref:class I SAM-dependent methyltransferase n=1 Tax=uncultured Candidatus Kuenenia sp. TaxID=1048336 RepID=UPI0025D80FB8|nr:class I SAM-dependent methyltransferase [uncultured Candidatus Kuenenia sp.]